MLVAVPFSASAQLARGKEDYEKRVLPVLQEFCYDCHGDGMDKGHFALDKHPEFTASFGDKKFWDTVREHVDTHVMPPDGKPQPTNEQRAVIVNWIEDEVFWSDPTRPDPGHITLRRLNRVEYNNTVRDVFRVETRPADAFPPDDSGYGYDNIGDVLTLSPLLMEKYLKAARKVSDEAVWVKPPERTSKEKSAHEFEDVNDASDKVEDEVRSIFKNGEISAKYAIPYSGLWRAELEISASQAGAEKARIAVLVDGAEVGQFDIKADKYGPEEQRWERLRFDLPMKSGNRTVAIRFLNDFFDEKAPDVNHRDRNAFVHYLTLQGPLQFRAAEQSKFLDWLCEGKKVAPASLTFLGSDFETAGSPGVGIYDDVLSFAGNGAATRRIDIPEDGTYTLRLSVSANQLGNELAKLNVSLGEMKLAEARGINVKGTDATEVWTFQPVLKKGSYNLRVEFINDGYEAPGRDRNALLRKVVVEAPAPSLGKDAEVLHAWVERLGLKAMRRPLDETDRQKLMALADMVLADGGSKLDALRLVSEAVMVSSKFLFRGGAEPAGPVEAGSVLVDEFTLASRLSYFLWSSAPDDDLLKLAKAGELRKNLPAQITRMIADWKGWAMAENFAGQWLQLRDVELVAPDQRRYPEFTGKLANEMKKESQLYFDFIYRGNRSVLEFLDSDYTFLTQKLADFYGIKAAGLKKNEFQKVSLEGTPRGGILTQGSILTLTSHPNRTSPVKRGKFLLENILGTPPPPAPQNVPAFREDRGAKIQGTLRQRFEAHRANPSCASCHAFLDPMGFAFENYDAIGRWRDNDNGQAVDATGQLLTGQKFNNAQELRKVLVVERKNEFTKCLIENLMTFALGRGLDYPDKPFVKQLTKNAAESGYKFQDIVKGVVESAPFQRMRAPAPAVKQAGAE